MIAFLVLAAIAVGASLLVVLVRNPVLSALWLALDFAAIAGIFVVLGAEFLAAVQLIVYAGAILVFFLFVIMLLNLGSLPPGDERPLQRGLGLWSAAVVAVVIAFAARAGPPAAPAGAATSATPGATAGAPAEGNTEALAVLLYRDYVFPFELASLLLTAAVVGAVVLARRGAPAAPAPEAPPAAGAEAVAGTAPGAPGKGAAP